MKNYITGEIRTVQKGLGFMRKDAENPAPSPAKNKNRDDDIKFEVGNLNKALNGDIVKAEVFKGKYGIEGRVVEIVSRKKGKYVGTIVKTDDGIVFVPDDKKCYTNFSIDKTNIAPNTKVQVEFSDWKENEKLPSAKVIIEIGEKGKNDVEMESIVLEKGFDWDFPKEVEEEANQIEKNKVSLFEKTLPSRRDMRETFTITIDPFDAKDFDDAISLKKIDNDLYEVGVHIADVSYYVKEGSALDREALKRGTSIYLVDRTIPMLPEVLSNDVCSLNPAEDKLTFSAIFNLDKNGKVHKSWFGRTVIHSDKRFTYENAQESIDKDGEFSSELKLLNSIAKKLQAEKFRKGAIEFEQDEIKFVLDKDGKPISVYKKERLDTHKLVEEFMLLANQEVAKYIFGSIDGHQNKNYASLYRIHDTPDKDKIFELAQFVKALGYDLHVGAKGITAQALNDLMKQVTGTKHEALVKTAAIRSMQKAIYSTKNIGHFGLAFDFYTHFTSPIRRYPDIMIHRIVQKHLDKNEPLDREVQEYQAIAEKSSEREVAAAEAERASKKLKQVEYMSTRVGEIYEGTISGVSEWGLYVEEKETKCEGMVKIRDLGNDFFEVNEKTYSVIGKNTKKKFTLGDSIKIKVMGVDTERRTIDYKLVS